MCQVVLGSKIHKPSAPKLGPMFTQVINTLFSNISNFKSSWINGKSGKDCPIFGQSSYSDPQGLSVDYKSLKKESIEGFLKVEKLIVNILSPCNYKVLKRMCVTKTWDITSKLWVKILYDFIYAYEISKNKKDIVEALKPIYFARATSFYRHTIDMTHEDSEKEILMQAEIFKKSKEYLVRKFNHGISISPQVLNYSSI